MEKRGKKDPQDILSNNPFASALENAGITLEELRREIMESKADLAKKPKSTDVDWESVKNSTAPLQKKGGETQEPLAHKPGDWLKNFYQSKQITPEVEIKRSRNPVKVEKTTHRKNLHEANNRGGIHSSTNHLNLRLPNANVRRVAKGLVNNEKRRHEPKGNWINKTYTVGDCADRKKQNHQPIEIPQNNNELVFTGELSPNQSAFLFRMAQSRYIPVHDGIETSLEKSADDERELIIGLDFGTSSIKVVLNDLYQKVFYAVPFYTVGSDNPYIHPSRVWLGAEGYSLDQGDEFFADLKLPLMVDHADPARLRHAAAFLALVIRHARGWLFTRHHDIYRTTNIVWSLNLGLPAEYSENRVFYKRFRQLALAAVNLAGDAQSHLTREIVDQYLALAEHALTRGEHIGELDVHPDSVNVYPEIGAQVRAFVESEAWDAKDRPFITMIDIGAGTVDISLFSVERGERSNHTYRFFQNSVEPNGVINLHRRRVDWLNKALADSNLLSEETQAFLDDISKTTDDLLSIPENLSEYLENLDGIPHGNADSEFFSDFWTQVSRLLHYTRQNRLPLNDEHWRRLPLFLCGGGSRMRFYRRIIEKLNDGALYWLNVELEILTRPANLRAEGLPDHEYDRLSVAYGLSFPKLGKIVPSHEISDLRRADMPIRERPIDPTDDG